MTLCMLDGFDDYSGLDTFKGVEDRALTYTAGGRSGSPVVSSGLWRCLTSGNPSSRSLRRYYLDATNQDDVVIVGAAFSGLSTFVEDLFVFGGDYVLGTLSGANPVTTHITIAWRGPTVGFTVWRGPSGSGTLLGSYVPPLVGGWMFIEARVKLHDTAGEVQVRVDETQVINLTGIDTRNAGTAAVINSVDLVVCQGGGQTAPADDFYICNEQGSVNNTFLGNVRIEVLRPNGTGAAAAWVGSDGDSVNNYILVADETSGVGGNNTATYIASSVVGDKDLHTYEDSGFNVGRPVRGVMMTTYAFKDDNNARSFRMVAREAGGTEAETADLTLLNNVYNVYTKIWELQPSGGAWTVAAVNAAQFGVKTT